MTVGLAVVPAAVGETTWERHPERLNEPTCAVLPNLVVTSIRPFAPNQPSNVADLAFWYCASSSPNAGGSGDGTPLVYTPSPASSKPSDCASREHVCVAHTPSGWAPSTTDKHHGRSSLMERHTCTPSGRAP